MFEKGIFAWFKDMFDDLKYFNVIKKSKHFSFHANSVTLDQCANGTLLIERIWEADTM